MKRIVLLLAYGAIFTCVHAQTYNQELVDQIHDVLEDCSYYEVTEDMFQLLSEDERLQNEEEIAYLKKIKYLIYVECSEGQKQFYDNFLNRNNLKDFKVLMRSRSDSENFTFFRKRKNDMNEYLLIHDGGLSYIVTSLNISTLQELSGIMNMVGELGHG